MVTGAKTIIERDEKHNHVEDLWDWLEPFAKKNTEAAFVIEGYIDGTSGSGELEDFRIEIAEGRITAYRSGWYTETSKDTYEDYDDFCEYFENADGSSVCTKEEYDTFDGEFIRMVGGEKISIFKEVPLDGPIVNREELTERGMR